MKNLKVSFLVLLMAFTVAGLAPEFVSADKGEKGGPKWSAKLGDIGKWLNGRGAAWFGNFSDEDALECEKKNKPRY